MDILFMVLFKLKGGDATSLVAGTAVLLMCAGAVMEFKAGSLEKVTEYVTDGFLFAIRIFAPVIVIGAFFFLGGNGITHILGDSYERGILNDWALWLAHHAPLNRYMTALLQLSSAVLQDWMVPAFQGFHLPVRWRGPLVQLQVLPFPFLHVWGRSALFLSAAER